MLHLKSVLFDFSGLFVMNHNISSPNLMAPKSAGTKLVTPESSGGVESRRHSIAKSTPGNAGESSIPHYRRASMGSCHDACKYGQKNDVELKERRSTSKKAPRSPLPRGSDDDVGQTKASVAMRRVSVDLRPPKKTSVDKLSESVDTVPMKMISAIKLGESVNSEPQKFSTEDTNKDMPTKLLSEKQVKNEVPINTIKPMLHLTKTIRQGNSSVSMKVASVKPTTRLVETSSEPTSRLVETSLDSSTELTDKPFEILSAPTVKLVETSLKSTARPVKSSSESTAGPVETSSRSIAKRTKTLSKSTAKPVETLKSTDKKLEASSKSITKKVEASNQVVKKVKASSKSIGEKPETSSKSAVQKMEMLSKMTVRKLEASPKSTVKKVQSLPKSTLKKVEVSAKSTVKKVESSPKSAVNKVGVLPKSSVKKVGVSPKPTVKKIGVSPKPTVKRMLEASPTLALRKVETSPKSTTRKANAFSKSYSKVGVSSIPTLSKYKQTNISEKHATSSKSNFVTKRVMSSMNPLEGSSGPTNSNLKMGRKAASSKVAARKLITPLRPSTPVKPSLVRIASINSRRHKSLKVVPHLKNQMETRRDECGKPDSDEVEEKTLYVIKMESGNKTLQSDQNASHDVDFSPSQSLSPPKFSSTSQEDPEESEYTSSEGEEEDSFSANLESEHMEDGEALEVKDIHMSKLKFRRGKTVELKSEKNSPRRLKFRRGTMLVENASVKAENQRTRFKKRYEPITHRTGAASGLEKVVLRRRDVQGKKDAQGLFNNVIEETANRLAEIQKSKVKALVGAFETVISLHERKPHASSNL